MNSFPLISVIVPCYNVELYLDKCVQSIVDQSYQNLEIFLVDDGATDSTPKLCDEWSLKDDRIKVIHKSNGGLSDARNVAIDVANGEYLVFIDSDDYVSIDYVESLYNLLVKSNADISVCSYMPFYEGTQPENKKVEEADLLVSSDKAIELMFYQKNFDNTAWGKLYKRYLFENIRYPYGLIYEDLALTYKLFAKSQKIAFTSAKNYFYLIRSNSLDGGSITPRRYESALTILKQLYDDKNEFSKEVKRAFECRILSFAFHILLQLQNNEKEKQEKLLEYVKKYRMSVFFNSHARLKSRVASLLSYGGVSLLNIFKKYGISR